MASFFSSNAKKSEIIKNNVITYKKNRDLFIKKYITTALQEIYLNINKMSLTEGLTSYQIDLEVFIKQNEYKALLDEYQIKNFRFTKDELQYLIQSVKEYYNKHGFNVDSLYGTTVRITWD